MKIKPYFEVWEKWEDVKTFPVIPLLIGDCYRPVIEKTDAHTRKLDIIIFPYFPPSVRGVGDPFGFINLDRDPKYYVKRCVGRPGDRVEVVKKEVFVNGVLRKGWWPEYYSDPSVIPAGEGSDGERDYFGPVVVPDGRYFMMGDNRDESFDSRYWGFAKRDDIYGRAVFRIWPLKAFGPLR